MYTRSPGHHAGEHGCHDALLYASDEEFVQAAHRHLREGAELGEELVLACTGERAELLMEALGDLSVSVLGNDDTYLSPYAATEAWLDATRRAVESGATGLRVVGELPPEAHAHPHTWPGWSRYEAVVNNLLVALPFNALCAYDARGTDPSLLWMALQTHPRTWEGGRRETNPYYRDPTECLRRWSDPPVLPIERAAPLVEVADIQDRAQARAASARVGEQLALHDTALLDHSELLPPADPTLVDASEYLVGLDEVLANALTHGRGGATLRMWGDHDCVVSTVTDAGDGFHDPYAGYTPTPAPTVDGRPSYTGLGLWLARQMCDELTFRHDEEGFTVRMRAELDVRFA